jgi:hypothetical protein
MMIALKNNLFEFVNLCIDNGFSFKDFSQISTENYQNLIKELFEKVNFLLKKKFFFLLLMLN